MQVAENASTTAVYVVGTCSVHVSTLHIVLRALVIWQFVVHQALCSKTLQADLCLLADIPAGVVKIITGKGDAASTALAAHPGIDHVRRCITACRAAPAAHAQ